MTSCALPSETIGWSPARTASRLAGRPPRLQVGDRVRLEDLYLTGYVVERAGPLLAIGWLNSPTGDEPAEVELTRTVWQVAAAPLDWTTLPPELVPS